VQPPTGVAQAFDEQPLHETVDIFVGACDEFRTGDTLFEDLAKRLLDRPCVVAREHSGFRECARPCQAAGDVVGEQAAIETK